MATGLLPQANDPTDTAQRTATPVQRTGAAPAERIFYRVDYRRVPLAEFWRENPKGIVGHALRKLTRARTTSSTDDPCVETLAPFEVARSAVPGQIAQRLSVAMSQLTALGFRDPIWHAIEDDVQRTTTYLASMTHESGRVWARVHNRVWHIRTPATSTLFCEIVSELAGSRFCWSLSSPQDLAAPPSCSLVRVVGASPNQLLAAHQSALAESGAGKPLPIHSTDDLRESIERHHAAVRGFHVGRGVFVPLSTDERESAAQFRDRVQSASEVGSRYPEILAEIVTQQNRKSSRANGVLLLLVSIAMFFGAGLTGMGAMQFSPDVLLILVGVLFVHETGHWIAMRVFGYRNMKMFFIPFFGAAVSGRHYNVPGWKKVIVSLAGPLPGIVGGAALGALGVAMHNAVLIKIAMFAVVLNGFNLLPILPLDGGWVVHAIVFSRHHLLELAFRIAALGALFLLAVGSRDNVLVAVAVAMSLSLPAMYKVAKITNELRRSTLPLASDDGQTLPQAVADIIIDRIKAAFPAKLTNRMAAQHTLQVFENLNARPPRALASVGLGIVHFGSLAGSVVAAVLIYAGVSNAAWHPLTAASMRVLRAQPDSALAEPRNTVFANLGKPAAMKTALGEMQRDVSSETAIATFGETAVLSLPFEDVDALRDVQTSLEKRGAKFLISSPSVPVMMQMSCTARSQAAAATIDREIGDYFDADVAHLLPPWQSAGWSAEERTRYARARRTLRRLRDAQGREQLRAVRAAPDVDTAVIGLYESLLLGGSARARPDSVADTQQTGAQSAIAPLLGTLPLSNGQVARGALDLSARGFLGTEKLAISIGGLRFENAFQGPPALSRWLLANGCTGVRYAITPGVEGRGASRRAATRSRDARK